MAVEGVAATSACSVTPANGFAGPIRLECSGQPSGVPCRVDPPELIVTGEASFTTNVVVDVSFMATPGDYTFQVVASGSGVVRSFPLRLTIAATCAGFKEQPSYAGDCRNRPPNTICWGFSDGYVWFVDDGFGAPGYELGPCGGRTVQVARGGRADYHHVLGTLLVKIGPRTRPQAGFHRLVLTLWEASASTPTAGSPSSTAARTGR